MNATPDKSRMLLTHHLKALRLPVFLRDHAKIAAQCATDQCDYGDFLFRLSEAEVLEREQKSVERRVRAARFPSLKRLEDFDFAAAPGVNRNLIIELLRCDWILQRENTIFLGNPGTGKTHLALALGFSACQKGHTVRFITAAGLVNALVEARNDKTLLRLQASLHKSDLLIVDELGYVPLSKSGSELLFDTLSQRYERGSVLVTSNLPFEEWTSVFGTERLTGALLDRLTHRSHILAITGDSYRLTQSKKRQRSAGSSEEKKSTAKGD